MQNLFSYPLVVDELTPSAKKYHLAARKEELPYITEILKVPAVKSLAADINVKYNKKEHLIKVWGKAEASIEQTSVISLENFIKDYSAEFQILYDTELTPKDLQEMEVEIDDDLPDPVIGGQINLADIAMEQIALVLDDFPRQEGETFEFQAEFDEETTQAQNPFAVLAKLKK
ncbi:MAG: DUF177 domain-containing protein [Proteobacteria bacterium]|nr:DUF177 domain-containing protein [Pseudomonadota bacterium]